LIPQFNPGDWVILDSATFHHGSRIQQLIEAAGCHLGYTTLVIIASLYLDKTKPPARGGFI
jgi:hypothetical protein